MLRKKMVIVLTIGFFIIISFLSTICGVEAIDEANIKEEKSYDYDLLSLNMKDINIVKKDNILDKNELLNINNDNYHSLTQNVINNSVISNDRWLEEFKLFALDGEILDQFGYSVSIDGEYAIIGVPYDDDNGKDSGSAYIFKRNQSNWKQEAKLLALDGSEYDKFGCSVSIDGNYTIIGAIGDDAKGVSSGSAYIFKRSEKEWSQEAKLLAKDGEALDQFGCAVAINEDYVLIGATGNNDNGEGSGSAYIFKRSGTWWAQEDKLLASDGESLDQFGYSVSIDGDYAIVGAIGEDTNGEYSGSAYIFKLKQSSWKQDDKIFALDGAKYDQFGCSVSIDGNYTIIGAHYDDDKAKNSGSAYIFERSETKWNQIDKLVASDGQAEDCFGNSVSIDKENAIIGANGDDDIRKDSGAAYIFKRLEINWTEQDKLLPLDGRIDNYFGCSVSINKDYAIIGSIGDNESGEDSGSAYIFKKNYPPNKPSKPTGKIKGNTDKLYPYSTNTTDPEGDNIKYGWDWYGNDNLIDEWDNNNGNYYISGEIINTYHSWDSEGTYFIKVIAEDVNGLQSEWSDPLVVSMPRNRIISTPFLNFLQNHPIQYQLFQRILKI